ncbi:response regulator [Euzebya tangerina]|uniref:response regulator n=1 Tax=Euzebya tangerina TaxID=591198 RepID=UPI000E31B916|nr:response regulator transcription factor [Euzebya tangerina]
MSEPIRVVIADDEPDMRLLLRMQLGGRPDFTVVGEAADGDEAVTEAVEGAADVVVMDLLMPGTSGFEGIAMLTGDHPDIAVVAYTAVAGEYVREEMSRLGIDLVLKSGDIEPLAQALLGAVGTSDRALPVD